MQPFTPAQLKSIQGWTETRDTLLRDIGAYTVERDELEKGNKEKGLASADLDIQISEKRGRLSELAALEERWKTSVSTEVSALEVRKSRLEGECAVLDERLKGGSEKYEVLILATGELQSAHDTMKDQAVIVNRVVGEIIQTSQLHTSDMKTMMVEIKSLADQVIEKGNENISHTTSLITTVPLFVAKLQKSIAAPRRYPKGHPRFVEVETE